MLEKVGIYMLEIIFVRHGESELNKQGLYCGWSNSFLTEKGLNQAEAVGKKLANEKIDLIITSDLDRCLMTAQTINKFQGAEIVKETALKELNFGDWEGRSYNEICREYPKKANEWQKDYIYFRMPKGESLHEMHQRVNIAFNKIVEKYKTGKILIVAHSGVIRSILSQLICGNIECCWKFKIDNCSITRLQFIEGYPVIIGMNQ